MKLFVQIPCLNEEATLPSVIRDIPRQIDGVDDVKVLVIDDGSSDATTEVAHRAGADHVVRLPYTHGLARAFSIGMNSCLELGAAVVVNIDGDHQFDGKDIPRLIQPILQGRADMVIGDRTAANPSQFPFVKRILLTLGSATVSFLSKVRVRDAASGFRAYSREAALRVNVFSKFSYTLETIIQAGTNHLIVTHVPIRTNPPTRKSRLFGTTTSYLKKSAATILRIYALYEPLRTLLSIGGLLLAIGAVGMLRFLFFWFSGSGGGHLQSLIVSAVFLIIGFQVCVIGILADLISVNRRLSEEILYRIKRRETSSKEKQAAPI